MGSKPLGRLSNAPLAYVLAQVRFQPVLEIANSIPTIQTALRQQYPRFREIQQAAVQIGSQELSIQSQLGTRWEFASESNCTGIIVQANSLTFHVTEYSTYDDFRRDFYSAMDVVCGLVPHILVERLGLRYIDFIIPERNETPESYVTDRLRCDPNPDLEYKGHSGITIAEYMLDEGRLVVRYMRNLGKPSLPPDLLLLNLEPSVIMKKEVDVVRETAILDTDRIVEMSAKFDVAMLSERFNLMHNDISKAFKALTTQHALAVWRKER